MRHVHPNRTRIVYDTIDGQVLIIANDTGAYYTLEGTGAAVWTRVAAGRSAEEAVDDLTAAYAADAAEVSSDVVAFIDLLLAEGLLDEGPPDLPDPAVALPDGGAWAAPSLAHFTDMQDLLQFDPIHEVGPEGWPNSSHERG